MTKALFWLSIFMLTAFSAVAQPILKYVVRFPQPNTHYAEVELTISGLNESVTTLHLPVWTPGSYLVREFARNIDSFSASVDGKPAPSRKASKSSWEINHGGAKSLTVRYRSYARELTVRTSFVDAEHAYINGTTLFMYHLEAMQQPHTVTFEPYVGWKRISTTLPQSGTDPWTRTAADYDQLVDCPVEIGNHEEFSFEADGITHRVAMFGIEKFPEKRLKKDYKRIIEASSKIFGHQPNKEYLFIVHHTLQGGGGLEHSSSTTLQTRPDVYEDDKRYIDFFGLVAHEYFHLWNVKRLRPAALGPFDYSKENYTTMLWFSEGFTSYYDNLLTRRVDLQSEEDYLEVLRSGIESVHGAAGDKIQSLAESSWDAWIKFYLRNENSGNISISYYRKGAMMGLVFDLALLHASAGKSGLDEFMKKLYAKYYLALNRGFTDAEFLDELRAELGDEANLIWENYILGTTQVDFNRYLAHAGMHVQDTNDGTLPYLGASWQRSGNRFVVGSIRSGSAAEKAGLNVGDVLLSVNGKEITDFDVWLKAQKPGEKFSIKVYRQTRELTFKGVIDAYPVPRYSWKMAENRTPLQTTIYNRIVGRP